jgi:hypothetical protein
MGTSLDEALASEFFQFFHMRIAQSEGVPGGTVRTFRPTAPGFHERVRLDVDADPSNRIRGIGLTLDRSFIDDDATEGFARDIVKSFLVDTVPPEEMSLVHDPVNDIWNRRTTQGSSTNVNPAAMSEEEGFETIRAAIREGRPVSLRTKGYSAPLAAAPSDAFHVFMGELEQCELVVPHAKYTLRNVVEDPHVFFSVTVAPVA